MDDLPPLPLPNGWVRLPGDGKCSHPAARIEGFVSAGSTELRPTFNWVYIIDGMPRGIQSYYVYEHSAGYDRIPTYRPEPYSYTDHQLREEAGWGQTCYEILAEDLGLTSARDDWAGDFELEGTEE